VKLLSKNSENKGNVISFASKQNLSQIAKEIQKSTLYGINLSQAVRARKLLLLLGGFLCAAFFWMVLVQYTLPMSKMATIELSVLEQESKMTHVEKLMYLNKLKKREKENALQSMKSL